MANLDTENKRRSATGIFHLYTIPPVPDADLDDPLDREQITLIYAGISAGIAIELGAIIRFQTDSEMYRLETLDRDSRFQTSVRFYRFVSERWSNA